MSQMDMLLQEVGSNSNNCNSMHPDTNNNSHQLWFLTMKRPRVTGLSLVAAMLTIMVIPTIVVCDQNPRHKCLIRVVTKIQAAITTTTLRTLTHQTEQTLRCFQMSMPMKELRGDQRTPSKNTNLQKKLISCESQET